MLELLDQVTVFLIVASAVAYVAWLVWSNIRTSSSSGRCQPSGCGCGPDKEKLRS